MISELGAVTNVDDKILIELIKSAGKRLIFMTPGMSKEVAEAFCSKWQELGAQAATVIIDADPEVCRLGYGTVDALSFLFRKAENIGGAVHQQPGIRIALLVADEKTIIYSPPPLLIEAGKTVDTQPNAIVLDFTPPAVAAAIGAGEKGSEEQKIGLSKVKAETIQNVKNDLVNNPPQSFDIARKIRVFNSRIEFVEFKMEGLYIARKTVRIPSDLVGLAKDEKTKRLLHSSFQLIDNVDTELSGKNIATMKDEIAKKYLIVLPNFGTVILRENKEAFQKAIADLKESISDFQKDIEKRLQKGIDENRKALLNALSPAVIKNCPERWIKYLGKNPTENSIKERLDSELAKIFGSAKRIISKMEVIAMFKGVTYEMLNDDKFIKILQEKFPNLKFVYEEYDAARQSKHGGRLNNITDCG
jgi:hypothetical protein